MKYEEKSMKYEEKSKEILVAVGERNAGCQAGERNICPQDSAAPTTSSSSRHLLLVKDIRRNIGMF